MRKLLIWGAVALGIVVRLALVAVGAHVYLSRRVEVVTPINSLMRLAEGRWLKKLGLSPYAGSAYHGSPLLLGLLEPLTNKGKRGLPAAQLFNRSVPYLAFKAVKDQGVYKAFHRPSNAWFLGVLNKVLSGVLNSTQQTCSFLVFMAADLIGALLLRSIGALAEAAHEHYVAVLHLHQSSIEQNSQLQSTPDDASERGAKEGGSVKLGLGNAAAILYLLNPFTIAVCVGGTTSPLENLMVILSLYGSISGNIPLATFGWAIATHLSLYPVLLVIPLTLLTICGPDRPQKKVLHANASWQRRSSGKDQLSWKSHQEGGLRGVIAIILWSALWWGFIIGLCYLAVDGHAQLREMISETYGFILTVPDLSPNLGLFWYFFTEVFTQFRPFFIMLFHANLLFAILPVTIRLYHRPMFLAFIFVAISTLLKSYPSVGDAALTLSLMSLCTLELTGFRYSFLILYGYLLIAILSPSMYNLWIWRGTGNANFYFAMTLVYSTLQSILVIESVGTVIRSDRKLKNSVAGRISKDDSNIQHGKAE